jgi:hypothetical protein
MHNRDYYLIIHVHTKPHLIIKMMLSISEFNILENFHHVSCVHNVAIFPGFSILDCPFGFLKRLFERLPTACTMYQRLQHI